MITQGWFPESITKSHYYRRDGKRFWNEYPPDLTGWAEGYFYKFKSLCGREDFTRPIRISPNLIEKLPIDSSMPCKNCLIKLAKEYGLL